jgi:inner membrane protein involved in colicin E2 resistance
MKGILLILVVIIGSLLVWNYAKPEAVKKTIKTIENRVSQKPIISQTVQKQYVFVPYWTFTKSIVTDREVFTGENNYDYIG